MRTGDISCYSAYLC